MKTVLDERIAAWLAANGYFYVMHRFDLDNVAFARQMREAGHYVSISSGVKPADRDVIDRLAADGVGARRSATKSAMVTSLSWPTAEMTGTGEAAIARATRWRATIRPCHSGQMMLKRCSIAAMLFSSCAACRKPSKAISPR